jgi:hypothetical protein
LVQGIIPGMSGKPAEKRCLGEAGVTAIEAGNRASHRDREPGFANGAVPAASSSPA